MRLIRCATLIMPVVAAPAVNDGNWKELVLESSVPVIVDFWAPWCGPCRMIAPLIDELAVEYGDKIKAVSSIPHVQQWQGTRKSIATWFGSFAAVVHPCMQVHTQLDLADICP